MKIISERENDFEKRKRCKIEMGENFLNEYNELTKDIDDKYLELETSTGKTFQDAYCKYPLYDWVKMTPEALYKTYKKNPNIRCKYALIAGNSRWYSTGKLKNVKLIIETYKYKKRGK